MLCSVKGLGSRLSRSPSAFLVVLFLLRVGFCVLSGLCFVCVVVFFLRNLAGGVGSLRSCCYGKQHFEGAGGVALGVFGVFIFSYDVLLGI